jgi:[protein-PII] uridylyltransferase
MAQRLAELSATGVLGQVIPELDARDLSYERVIAPVHKLEQLLKATSLSGNRYGTMLRELSNPDLLVLALLLRSVHAGRPIDETLNAVRSTFDHLQLSVDSRHIVEFLLRDDLRMGRIAFSADADDPETIDAFAGYLNTAALFNTFTIEEHLKLLCLMTLVTADAEGTLTPLKSELLWRLFVDTYNRLLKAYGDQVIDASTIARTALNSHRPPTVSEAELVAFLEGMPKRYLTLFDADSIYEHVRVCRDNSADDVHVFLKNNTAVGELTVITLDKPFLFSNICGVLSYLGMDIIDGQALTTTRGLVLDLFRFHAPHGFIASSQLNPLLIDVVAGRVDIAQLFKSKDERSAAGAAPAPPVIAFDNEASDRFTVLEIVAQDAPGLLYRISRAFSTFRGEIEMVVMSTEGDKAIDVFHVRKDGAKILDSDELPLTELLERAIEGTLA